MSGLPCGGIENFIAASVADPVTSAQINLFSGHR